MMLMSRGGSGETETVIGTQRRDADTEFVVVVGL